MLDKIEIGVIAGGDSDIIDLIVDKVKEQSGDETIDWGYIGGRALVWSVNPSEEQKLRNKQAFKLYRLQYLVY